ncbi:PREDICTED: cyclin-D4-2-like [Ipomoea nil]|uniref:cyclin-D4-2-like n=1 Tax=Ipomoea nil TaxID=35883 RepID=UPI0009008C5F|nr:PREDICTED: cyclin-D4-2-like [Ipomoea nil]
MAENNHDYFSTSLLCMETKSICFDDDDSLPTDEHSYQSYSDENFISDNGRSEPFIDLPSLSEESFAMMVERETQHSPQADYLRKLTSVDLLLSMRIEAFDWIWKVHSHFGFGVLSFCLSIMYLDRFLSVYELNGGQTWTVQVLALGCLSLAIKMEEIYIPWAMELKVVEPKVFLEGESIQIMELHVMSTLKWRMHSCTPCTFIDYFLKKFNGDRQITSGPLISRSMHLIACTMKGIEFLEFRPSEVATAVALFVSKEMQSTIDLDNALSSCFTQEALKERVMKCYELIQDLASSLGPNWELEADESSSVDSSHTNPCNKRRRADMTKSRVRAREESPGTDFSQT